MTTVARVASALKTRPRRRSGTVACSPYVDRIQLAPPPAWATTSSSRTSQKAGATASAR